jgi:RimJ/RimL family protein N-acetyltransferase
VLGSLVPELLGRAPAPIDRSVPELTYIVASEPGRGLGRSLLGAFAAGLLERGTKRFELSVDEGNPGAIAFYERTGFRRVGEYEEFGRRHFRYAFGG